VNAENLAPGFRANPKHALEDLLLRIERPKVPRPGIEPHFPNIATFPLKILHRSCLFS
jgi:hypothetical protein